MSARDVTIVASEVLGRAGTGGAGTADSLLAVALARHGHRVRLLAASGREIGELDDTWRELYASSGVEVRVLEHLRNVTPGFLRPSLEVLDALRADPPDVVIADDWRGLGYLAQRTREVGLALQETAFVVHCHGPARMLAEFARKVPDTRARFGEQVMERVSLELADAVVSPSDWLLEWMRGHRWPVPASATTIPYLREWVALGEHPPSPPARAGVRRLAFFGQLREGKGIRLYLAALNSLDRSLLEGVELLFLGRETPRWNAATIEDSLPPAARARLGAVRVEPALERAQALAELRRPGTLAVMPSLLDNSPNTVSECIENGIPFIATRTGGIPELVAPDDRARLLCEPDPRELASALERALREAAGVAPAAPSADPEQSLARWLELVDRVEPPAVARRESVASVDVLATDEVSEERARRLAQRTTGAEVQVVRAPSRRDALEQASSELVLFLDESDAPEDDLLERLVAAQRACDADAVTCAVRVGEAASLQLFLGDPGALGLAENQYGVLGLVRRALVRPHWSLEGVVDPDWILFARLALDGARIVSIPEPLSTFSGRVGGVTDVPGDALDVLEAFEEDESHGDLPQLAATLAAAYARSSREPKDVPVEPMHARGLRVLREEVVYGAANRIRKRLRWR